MNYLRPIITTAAIIAVMHAVIVTNATVVCLSYNSPISFTRIAEGFELM